MNGGDTRTLRHSCFLVFRCPKKPTCGRVDPNSLLLLEGPGRKELRSFLSRTLEEATPRSWSDLFGVAEPANGLFEMRPPIDPDRLLCSFDPFLPPRTSLIFRDQVNQVSEQQRDVPQAGAMVPPCGAAKHDLRFPANRRLAKRPKKKPPEVPYQFTSLADALFWKTWFSISFISARHGLALVVPRTAGRPKRGDIPISSSSPPLSGGWKPFDSTDECICELNHQPDQVSQQKDHLARKERLEVKVRKPSGPVFSSLMHNMVRTPEGGGTTRNQYFDVTLVHPILSRTHPTSSNTPPLLRLAVRWSRLRSKRTDAPEIHRSTDPWRSGERTGRAVNGTGLEGGEA